MVRWGDDRYTLQAAVVEAKRLRATETGSLTKGNYCSGCGVNLTRAAAHHIGCPRAGLDYCESPSDAPT
jgi:hypothetical protein